MKALIISYITVIVAACSISSPTHAGDWYDRNETFTVPVADIENIDFTNMDFTQLEYIGVQTVTEIKVSITFKVYANGPEAAEEAFGQLGLDIDRSDDAVQFKLDHPKQQESNFFSMLFRRSWKKWKAEMTVTGPIDRDMHFDGDFSDMEIRNTEGEMVMRNDFSDIRLTNHTGMLDAKQSFGSLLAEHISGRIKVSCEFGDANLDVTELTGDSELSVEFGNADLHLPADAAVSISTSQSFGDVDFHMAQPVTIKGSSRNITLNDGGIALRLSVEFGDINITDRGGSDVSMR